MASSGGQVIPGNFGGQSSTGSGTTPPQQPKTVAITRFAVHTIRHNKALKTRDAVIRAIFNYIWDTEIRNSQGNLILSMPEKRCFLQSGLTNQLYEITPKDENFTSYLWYRYGLLDTEQVTRHTVSALKSYCRVLGRIRDVRRFTFFDQTTDTLYVSRYDGTCWKIDGDGFEKVPNGTGSALFIDDDGGTPVKDPIIGYHGKLLPMLVEGVQFVESTQGGMTPEQQRLALAIWLFAIAFPDLMPAKPILLCEGEKGAGKCLGQGTPVLMADGTVKPVEDVCVGDRLMGPDSTPRTVQETSRGHGPLFRIIPVKGESWVCNENHIMTVVCAGKQKNGQWRHRQEVIDVPLTECKQGYQGPYVAGHGPVMLTRSGIELPPREVPVDPYLVGLWLGDGKRGEAHITTGDEKVVAYCQRAAEAYGLQLTSYPNTESSALDLHFVASDRGGVPNPLRQFFRSLAPRGPGGEKRIPDAYLRNSRINRLELLAGLLDADGHNTNNCFEITTKWKGFADDLLYLVRSLGLAAYCNEKPVRIGDELRTYYRVSISGGVYRIPCKLKRKHASHRQQRKDALHTGFSIEPIGEGDYYGFTLDGDARFLLGDFTVTHNSVAVQLIQRAVHGKQKTHQISKNDEKDFGVKILRSPICLLDNMDNFVDWLQDTIAAFTTGEGWTRRKLYTDDQEVEVKPQAFLAITSRNPMSFKRDDIADRCVILRLERRESNQALSLLFKKVFDDRPALFGEWLWFLNETVKLIRAGKLVQYAEKSPHRLADFAALSHVIGDVLGVTGDEVEEMLDAMQAERDVLITEGDPLIDLLDRWLENTNNVGRQMIATDLHKELSEIARRYSRSFYKSPATLAQKLRAQPIHKQFDVRVVGQRGNAKLYEFRRLKEDR